MRSAIGACNLSFNVSHCLPSSGSIRQLALWFPMLHRAEFVLSISLSLALSQRGERRAGAMRKADASVQFIRNHLINLPINLLII